MTDFEKKLGELRESIFRGGVSEGIAQLGAWLVETRDPEEREEIQLDMVLVFLMCGDLEEAEQHWKEAMSEATLLSSVRLMAFDAFFVAIHTRRGINLGVLDHCIETDPENYEYHLLRAMAFLHRKKYAHAQADLDRANTLCPNNILIMSIIADVNAELGNPDKAMALHEAVLEACPDFRRSLMNLGTLYFDRGRKEDAFRLFECLVAYDPVNWFAWNCIADILESREGYSMQALPYYAASIVSGSEANHAWLNLARGLVIQNRYEEAVHVLHHFRHDLRQRWEKEERYVANYITLIADAVSGKATPDAIPERLRQCRGFDPELNEILMRVLCRLANTTIRAPMHEIFACQMTAYADLAEFMSRCANHTIAFEEALAIGAVVHMLIWHGMLFEACSFLRMLASAEDPRLLDMASMRWNEVYTYIEAAHRCGCNPSEFHEYLLRAPSSESYLHMLMTGSPLRAPREWRDALCAAMMSGNMEDFRQVLFTFPTDDAFGKDSRDNAVSRGDRYLRAGKWFSAWQASDKSAQDFLAEAAASPELSPADVAVLRNLMETKPVEETAPLSGREQADRAQVARMVTAAMRGDRELPSDEIATQADNENEQPTCGASLEDALMDGEPLPFTIDGSAFQRQMSATSVDARELDASSYGDVFRQWAGRFATLYRRISGNDALPDGDDGTQDICEGMRRAWAALHGEMPTQDAPFGDPAVRTCLDWVAGDVPTCRMVLPQNGSNPFALRLPASPMLAAPMRYAVQRVPATPAYAKNYAVPVAANYLNLLDIYEMFFNRAVVAIEAMDEDEDALSVFLDGSFRFHSESRLGASNDNACECIESTHELAQALRAAQRKLSKQEETWRLTEFRKGHRDHEMLDQIRQWAEKHARELLTDVMQTEAQIRDLGPGSQFMVLWKLHDILKTYPFLSRLYLLIAAVHAKLQEPDKAMQAIQAGLAWEDRLYAGSGWLPVRPGDDGTERGLEAENAYTEFEEKQYLLWNEHFVFQPHDEAMYHYADYASRIPLRRRRRLRIPAFIQRIVENDKGGAFDFYRIFRRLLLNNPAMRDSYLSAVATPGVETLRDYMVFLLRDMTAPQYFPLRRQIAECLHQLYPLEDTGALARFYCDNLQPANALPLAAYSFFAEAPDSDSSAQSAVTLGCLLYDMGFMDEAMHFLKKALRVKNPSPMAYLTQGCALIEMRKFHEAIDCLKKGQQLDPSSDRFQYNMALAYIELGELDEAEQAVKAGMELSKYPVDLNMQLLRIYVKKGLFENALALARYVAGEDPDLFCNAIKYPEFDEFVKMRAVRALLKQCGCPPEN